MNHNCVATKPLNTMDANYPTGTNVVKLPIAKNIENANHALAMSKVLRKYIGHLVYQAHNNTRTNGTPDAPEYMMSRLELEKEINNLKTDCKTAFNELRIVIKSKQQELSFYRKLLDEYEVKITKYLTPIIQNIATEPSSIQEIYNLAQQYGVNQLDNPYRIMTILGDVHSTSQPNSHLHNGLSGQNYYIVPHDQWTVTSSAPYYWTYHGKA